jgi:hypothetical protein
MPESSPKFLDLLRPLAEAGVDYIVVGGVAAVLQGAPVTTFDLDIVHCRDPENLDRLLGVLRSLDAHFRGHPERRLEPELHHLASSGHQLLLSNAGPVDFLGTIDGGRDYEDLVDHSVVLELETEPIRIRVLDLETLIGVKERLGRPKDQAVLAVLRATLSESKRRG